MKRRETKSAPLFVCRLFTQESHKIITRPRQIPRENNGGASVSARAASYYRKLNTLFLPDLDIWHVRFLLNGPDFRDPLEIAKVLTPFIQAGAVSPNDLRDLAGRILGKTLEEWPEEFYHRPLESRIKTADGLSPSESNQLEK